MRNNDVLEKQPKTRWCIYLLSIIIRNHELNLFFVYFCNHALSNNLLLMMLDIQAHVDLLIKIMAIIAV